MRSLIICAIALTAVLLCGGSARAADNTLTGMWSGTYEYPPDSQKAAVRFSMIMLQGDKGLIGFVQEPNTFGEGADPLLHASVEGSFDPASRKLRFEKKYDGTGKTSHTVEYTAQVSADGKTIDGTWKVPDVWQGNFKLRKDTETGFAPLAGVWIGAYSYPEGSGQQPVEFTMVLVGSGKGLTGVIIEPKTFGDGDAPWLHASVKGQFDDASRELSYTKTYDGTAKQDHDVEYRGQVSSDGAKVTDGVWKLGSLQGTFTLSKAATP